MKKYLYLIGLALGLGLLLVPAFPAAEQEVPTAKPPKPQWEHLAFTQNLAAGETERDVAPKIIKLGKASWELVSVANHSDAGTTTKTIYYFKRPL